MKVPFSPEPEMALVVTPLTGAAPFTWVVTEVLDAAVEAALVFAKSARISAFAGMRMAS